MHYIVLDLEWNCVMIPKKYRKSEIEHPSEIIEIGAVKLNEKKKIVDKFSVLIKPFFIKKIQKYIVSVTHLTDGQLAHGIAFPKAVKQFFDFCGDDYVLCTWGASDLPELKRNINYYSLDFKVPDEYIDLQLQYALCFNMDKNQTSVESAVKRLRIKEKLDYHRAINDAIYTAKIFQKTDLNKARKIEEMLEKSPEAIKKKKTRHRVFRRKPKKVEKVVVNKKPMNVRTKPKKVFVVTNKVESK